MKNDATDTINAARDPMFLKSFRRFRADLRIVSAKDEFLSGSQAGQKFRGEAWFRLLVQTLISLVVLGVGLYILLSARFDENMKKIGSGFIGTVVGYWLS
jgi:hypothetical protein